MADQLEGARTLPVKFRDMGDGSVAEILASNRNLEVTALASLARTAGGNSSMQTNPDARGLQILWDITAHGTGTLTLCLRGGFGLFRDLITPMTITAATGQIAVELYPGASGIPSGPGDVPSLAARYSGGLPRSFFFNLKHSDASSWTYAVSYALIG